MVGMVLSSALLTCQRAGEAAPLPVLVRVRACPPERLSRRKSRAIGPAPRMVTHVLGAGVPRVTPWKRAECRLARRAGREYAGYRARTKGVNERRVVQYSALEV